MVLDEKIQKCHQPSLLVKVPGQKQRIQNINDGSVSVKTNESGYIDDNYDPQQVMDISFAKLEYEK